MKASLTLVCIPHLVGSPSKIIKIGYKREWGGGGVYTLRYINPMYSSGTCKGQLRSPPPPPNGMKRIQFQAISFVLQNTMMVASKCGSPGVQADLQMSVLANSLYRLTLPSLHCSSCYYCTLYRWGVRLTHQLAACTVESSCKSHMAQCEEWG